MTGQLQSLQPIQSSTANLPILPKLEDGPVATNSEPESPLNSVHESSPVDGSAGIGSKRAATDTPMDSGKPRQKRNKPTLSCVECVERKTKVSTCDHNRIVMLNADGFTKCDRGRPNCLACVKRQSVCEYTPVANMIRTARSVSRQEPIDVETDFASSENKNSSSRMISKPAQKIRKANLVFEGGPISPVVVGIPRCIKRSL